jgi:hypothetical protein
MAAGSWTVYNKTKLAIGNKAENLSADTFKMALFTSASNVGSASLSPATKANATNELATAAGYTAGGVTLTGVTWSDASGTETFTSGNAQWTAAGGSITARYAVVYNATSGDLVAFCLLDTTPADVTAADGSSLTIAMNAAGIFTLA